MSLRVYVGQIQASEAAAVAALSSTQCARAVALSRKRASLRVCFVHADDGGLLTVVVVAPPRPTIACRRLPGVASPPAPPTSAQPESVQAWPRLGSAASLEGRALSSYQFPADRANSGGGSAPSWIAFDPSAAAAASR